MTHESFMQIALDEAIKGCGWVNPNPMVGAVIVKEGQIIGKGYHEKFGSPHAERNAIASSIDNVSGSTLYVTLEPCCHYGKTPPCTDAIIENGISTVVIGSVDPNQKVAGKGIKILQDHGINVVVGVLAEKCISLNEVFFHYIQTGKPFVSMKYAMTIDGKIATSSGKSRWITDEEARAHTHALRNRYSAIMVGIGTVLKDDPLLNCRLPKGRDPIRIICDSNLRIPENSQIVKTAAEIETYIATVSQDFEKANRLKEKGIRVIRTDQKEGRVDLGQLMDLLGENKIDSVLLEGGAGLHASALQSGIVNKAYVYIAPKIFGGSNAKTPVGGIGIDDPKDAVRLYKGSCSMLGDDFLLEFYLK